MPRKAELTMIQEDSAHESGRRKLTMGQKVRNRERRQMTMTARGSQRWSEERADYGPRLEADDD